MHQLLLSLTTFGLLLTAADENIIGERNGKEVVTVRVTEAIQSKQALPVFPGISANNRWDKGSVLIEGRHSAW